MAVYASYHIVRKEYMLILMKESGTKTIAGTFSQSRTFMFPLVLLLQYGINPHPQGELQ